jgi:hypothetical protein
MQPPVPNEKLQARDLIRGQQPRLREVWRRQPGIEASQGRRDGAFESRNRLADVCEDLAYDLPLVRRHAFPGSRCIRIGDRAGVGRKRAYFSERSEDLRACFGIVRRHDMRILGTVAAMFDRALERTEGLRPEAVLAPVPEQEGTMRRSGDRHGATAGLAHAPGERPVVLKLPVGQVACGAGHLSVQTEPGIEEYRPAQFHGARVVGETV